MLVYGKNVVNEVLDTNTKIYKVFLEEIHSLPPGKFCPEVFNTAGVGM